MGMKHCVFQLYHKFTKCFCSTGDVFLRTKRCVNRKSTAAQQQACSQCVTSRLHSLKHLAGESLVKVATLPPVFRRHDEHYLQRLSALCHARVSPLFRREFHCTRVPRPHLTAGGDNATYNCDYVTNDEQPAHAIHTAPRSRVTVSLSAGLDSGRSSTYIGRRVRRRQQMTKPSVVEEGAPSSQGPCGIGCALVLCVRWCGT